MKMSTITSFMQMNGAITGWREGIRWLRLPTRRADTIESVFGSRFVGRGGLRISSTVVSGDGLRKLREAHAPGGVTH